MSRVGNGLLVWCVSVMAGVLFCLAMQALGWADDAWAAHRARRRRREVRRAMADDATMSLAEWARRAS